ncbi:MAG: hydroxymethylpyrimidine/phosphomethylpyrimidine kinase [Planctomycetota bacterium]|nr:MAG: hydroxymethylpyrimidine/phosphomethylpyrimidine kinase [Planctomycetota bacterium]
MVSGDSKSGQDLPAPYVVSVAGSDPGGGAGLQLDLKVMAALGLDGGAVPAVLTAQDASGLQATEAVPRSFFVASVKAALERQTPMAVKTGALGDAPQVDVLAKFLEARPEIAVVCDPVGLASRSARLGLFLLTPAGIQAMRTRLFPRVTLLTPNLPELAAFTGVVAKDVGGMEEGAQRLLEAGVQAVLVKGGHLPSQSPDFGDLLLTANGQRNWYPETRLCLPRPVHGTGCALSTAIACFLAKGLMLPEAVMEAKRCFRPWLEAAKDGRLRPHL